MHYKNIKKWHSLNESHMRQECCESALEQRPPAPHKSDEQEEQYHTDPRFPSCIRDPPWPSSLRIWPHPSLCAGATPSTFRHHARWWARLLDTAARPQAVLPAWISSTRLGTWSTETPATTPNSPPPPPPRNWRLHFCQWLFITLETKHSTGSQPYSSQSPGWWPGFLAGDFMPLLAWMPSTHLDVSWKTQYDTQPAYWRLPFRSEHPKFFQICKLEHSARYLYSIIRGCPSDVEVEFPSGYDVNWKWPQYLPPSQWLPFWCRYLASSGYIVD